jgi:RNA polymerase sigma-70 factor (ECF subfamily)
MVDLDRITIEQAARGDEKAFRKVYDHYSTFVWRVVFRSVGSDREMVEEIVQETFVKIHQSLKKFAADSSLGTWIFRIAFNTSKSFWAKKARERDRTVPLIIDRADPVSAFDAFEAGDAAEKVLAELPVEDRFLLVSREVEGLSFDEIAEITGKSSAALRTRMSRIKHKIGIILENKPQLKEAVA